MLALCLQELKRGVGEDGVVPPQGNSSSCPVAACLFRSRTRRTISQTVTACPFFEVNAVYSASATSASEIQARSWSSQIAREYLMAVQASPGMAAMAALTLGSIGTVTENRAPARRIAAITLAA